MAKRDEMLRQLSGSVCVAAQHRICSNSRHFTIDKDKWHLGCYKETTLRGGMRSTWDKD